MASVLQNLRWCSDPFDADEPNPQLTNAIDSSLWELYSQRSHYHAAASTLARVFEEAFTKPNYSLEDFLDHTYSTVCASPGEHPYARLLTPSLPAL